MRKRRLLIIYDWFYPGFKAGGPIQSLTNLAVLLIPEFEIYVITSAYDLNSPEPYNNIIVNSWNKVSLPGSVETINIFFVKKNELNKNLLKRLLNETDPSVVYLNGIFSYKFFLLPLKVINNINAGYKVVLCPRGMLKKGALAGKAFKKKMYIAYLKLSRLLKNTRWHATTAEEADDIRLHFPENKGVFVAPNIPKSPFRNISFPVKEKGQLKVVYLSLINGHKNLLLLLALIKEIETQVSLDIYGPIVDEAYWKQCEVLIQQMPGKVQYKGLVQPGNVQDLLSQYHTLILLTKGENFGHALFESLSVGRPVITSNFTPWQNLYEKKAGVNVNIESMQECEQRIRQFADMEQEEYNTFCVGGHAIAISYFTGLDTIKRYRQLFS